MPGEGVGAGRHGLHEMFRSPSSGITGAEGKKEPKEAREVGGTHPWWLGWAGESLGCALGLALNLQRVGVP